MLRVGARSRKIAIVGGRGLYGRTWRAGGLLLAVAALAPGAVVAQAASRGDGTPAAVPYTFRWALQRPGDLLRYNRVEALSIGARGSALPTVAGRPVSLIGTARLGLGDLRPDLRAEARHAALGRTDVLALYHELAPMDGDPFARSPFASLMALLAGRDDADWYVRTGAELALTRAGSRTLAWRVAIHTERHRAAETSTRIALPRAWDRDGTFRPNPAADEGWEHALEGSAGWITSFDPRELRFGFDLEGLAAIGAHDFARGAATVHAGLPLPAGLGADLALRIAGATGAVPLQRLWAVGGPATLRGYGPRARTGPCAWTARAELGHGIGAVDVVGFMDAGWAGRCDARLGAEGEEDALASWGLAAYLVDRVIRVSWGRAVDGSRERLDLLVSIAGWR